jgi:hypothetical protein
MVKNPKILERFERRLQRTQVLTPAQRLKIAEELLKLARQMGKFPPVNRLKDIECDIRYAKAINGV